jgi:hypothetical protein
MSAESDKNFREYATRVSFNISLSRNQIAVLHSVRLEQSLPLKWNDWDRGPVVSSVEQGRRAYESVLGSTRNLWVPGVKPLITMGFVTWHDPALMVPKWSEHVYRLTKPGELMCQMLELAGIIPKLSTANENKKQRRKSA